MSIKEVLSIRRYKAGYEIRTELIDGDGFECKDFTTKSAYTPEGDYIGNSKWAYRLCKLRGIKPEKITSEYNICSIGFCERNQKWFGWSHRAIYGFGIGSTCKKGDCHYQPRNKDEFLEDCVRFWDDEYRLNITGREANEEGVLGIHVEWEYDDKVPNDEMRGTINGVFVPYPTKMNDKESEISFGKGEWIAETLEDAKQMAIDFAEDVS